MSATVESRYAIGRQPCANFTPKDELFTGSGNVHECLAPFVVPAHWIETK